MDSSSLPSDFDHQNKKFELSCKQLLHLTNQILCLKSRLDRAECNNHRLFADLLRLRLAALEGFRGQLHQYSIDLADRLDEMEGQASTEEDSFMLEDEEYNYIS